MQVPPDHDREAARLELLRRCAVLDTSAEPDFDTLAQLAAQIAGTPIALVSLVDASRQWFKARHGLLASETPRSEAFCAHAILQPEQPLVVPNSRADPRFAGNPLVEGAPFVASYAGIPLRVGAERLPLGTLCVLDQQARPFSADVLTQLGLLARQVEMLLELRLRQREVEERLARVSAEERRVQTLVATMGEGIVAQRADGAIISCNPAAERILGLTADQLTGRTSLDPRWHATRSDGTPFPGEEHPAMRALQTGLPVTGVVMGVGTDARRWIQINAQPIDCDASGKPQGVVCSFSDITELRREAEVRRHAEAQVDRLFRLSKDLMCIVGADGRFQRVNAACERALGWTAAELTSRPFLEFIHPDDRAATLASMAEVRLRGALDGFTNRYQCRDGSYRSLRWSGASDGKVGLATARDVTDELARQDELVRAKEAAEAADRAKSEFLATMSHEIRTPMNGVLGLTEVLLDGQLTDDQRDMLVSIRDSGMSLLTILNDILDWSRIEAGRLALEVQAVDPAGVARDVVTVLRPQAASRGLTLDVDALEVAAVTGDVGRVRQVLFNLIGNAIKFTPSGRVQLRFRREAASVEFPFGAGRFDVEDTGIGIPAGRLGALFQRFTQVDASTTRRFGGSGLGLAISLQLARLMGGSLTASSVEGKGSTFTLRLPLSAQARAVAEAPSLTPLGHRQRALRVLLAEDNAVNQRVVTALLGSMGHQVEVATTGRAAVDRFSEQQWDLVLLDVQMPEMDGIEAARLMRELEQREHASRLPILALTASAMKEEQDACLSAGMDAVLAKPVTREVLRSALSHWCA